MAETNELIMELLSNPEQLLMKKPFWRGVKTRPRLGLTEDVDVNDTISVIAPNYRKVIVEQSKFVEELDPYCHEVLFDDNIPSFCVKTKDGGIIDVRYKRVSLPIQRIIKDKQVLHLCANKMQFTLMDTKPSDSVKENFITFRQYWDLRNQDGMKTKMVDAQKSYGDAGLLYYINRKGEIRSRLISYADGFVICPHNDKNGDRILESIYYLNGSREVIDSYDDKYMYRHTRSVESEDESGWTLELKVEHGFDEIPLITKRGNVAWNDVQTQIEGYEALYNIFLVVQKRFGNGLLYIKGKFKEDTRKIAGAYVLNDSSIDSNGDARFLTPPTPENMLETMQSQLEAIMLGSKTTFVLPKDIKTNGDVSGLAVQLTRELDILNAEQAVIDWQNVADKMTRLFKQGLAIELVNKKIKPNAVTEFEEMDINAKFKVWRPFNEVEYNSMLIQLHGAGLISKTTGIELNTASKPDEKARIALEKEEEAALTAMTDMQNTNEDIVENEGGDE